MVKYVNKNDRAIIHKYAEENKIHAFSHQISKSLPHKHVELSLTPILYTMNMDDFNKFFIQFYKYSIENYDQNFFAYYLNLFRIIYPSIEKNYAEMVEICSKKFNNNVMELKKYIDSVKVKMTEYVTKNEKYKIFVNTKFAPLLKT